MKTRDKTNLPNNLFRFYFRYTVRPAAILVSVWFVCLLASQIMRGFLGPMIDKWFYGLFETGLGGGALLRVAIPTILFVSFLRLVWTLADGIRGYIGIGLRARNYDRVIITLSDYVSHQSVAYHRNSMPGKIHAFIHNVAAGASRIEYPVLVLGAVLIIVFGGYAIVKTQSIFLFIILGFYAAKVAYICAMLTRVRKYAVLTAKHSAEYNAIQLDYIENTIITKLFGIKIKNVMENSDDRNKALKYDIRRGRMIISMWAIPNIFECFMRLALMLICLDSFINGSLNISEMILVFSLLGQISGIITSIMDYSPDFIDGLSTAAYAYHQLVQPIEIQDAPDAAPLRVTRGKIEFENVSFAYKNKSVLKKLNLTIKPGERVGLVGASGAGKTTLANLIMRFYDPSHGRILIDGQDIKDVTQQSLHDAISFIPQEPTMFNRSLRDNIGFGRPGASMAEIRRVARLTNADKFINETPEKYDTIVGDRGIKLSGGQRQRIAIARAFLKDAPILILDEATSALDSGIENTVQSSFENLARGRTTLVIAHRLSTLRNMNRIVVIDRGQIVESGTHAQLIRKKNGIYAHLWQLQGKGFIK